MIAFIKYVGMKDLEQHQYEIIQFVFDYLWKREATWWLTDQSLQHVANSTFRDKNFLIPRYREVEKISCSLRSLSEFQPRRQLVGLGIEIKNQSILIIFKWTIHMVFSYNRALLIMLACFSFHGARTRLIQLSLPFKIN